jgi:diacylglycerol kinase family enzyme
MIGKRNFRHIVIVRNPVSTNVRLAGQRIEVLKRAFPSMTFSIIDTLPGGRLANAQLLRKHAEKLGEKSLLAIAGGDGTINMIIEYLMNDPELSHDARKTPILSLWGGNANDLAYMLNGHPRLATLPMLIRNSRVITVAPLACNLTDTNGDTTYHSAVCYLSFGASASTVQYLGRSQGGKTRFSQFIPIRFFKELLIVITALRVAPTFAIEEGGDYKTVYEYALFNGSRFAKVSGIKGKLTDPTFQSTIVERKQFADVIKSAASLTLRSQSERLATTHVEFRILKETWMQLDGESQVVPPGTYVSVSVSKQTFNALSVRYKTVKAK